MLLPLGVLRAQTNVEIVAESANAAGRRVELLAYEDMLSCREQVLASCVADSMGRFRLACYLNYPRLVVVQIECYSQSFYVEPGRTYHVWLPEFKWEQDEERNVYLAPVALPLEFIGLPADELNLRIARFEAEVDTFLSVNRVHLDPSFKPQRRWMDSLVAHCTRPEVVGSDFGREGSFFARYVNYTLASMRYTMGFASRKQMLTTVLPQPILYHDECYMRAMFNVLDGMVSKGMRKVPKQRLVEWVHGADLLRYLDSLGTEPLLYDEQLRELAAIVALKESFYDPDYDPEGVQRMLQAIASRSKWAEHRYLAERLLTHFTHHISVATSQAPLPTLQPPLLPDADRQMVNLNDLAGKWIYLSFVRVGDPASLREIEALAFFKDSVYAHHDDVVFVSVSCDREFQKMYHFLRNNRRGPRYSWTWLHFDGNYRWLEKLGVMGSYPYFILIDPEGRQPYSVTPTPGSGFLLHAPWDKQKAEIEKLEFTD